MSHVIWHGQFWKWSTLSRPYFTTLVYPQICIRNDIPSNIEHIVLSMRNYRSINTYFRVENLMNFHPRILRTWQPILGRSRYRVRVLDTKVHKQFGRIIPFWWRIPKLPSRHSWVRLVAQQNLLAFFLWGTQLWQCWSSINREVWILSGAARKEDTDVAVRTFREPKARRVRQDREWLERSDERMLGGYSRWLNIKRFKESCLCRKPWIRAVASPDHCHGLTRQSRFLEQGAPIVGSTARGEFANAQLCSCGPG
jgi:hypothetical protein